jgi:hypothetical protein
MISPTCFTKKGFAASDAFKCLPAGSAIQTDSCAAAGSVCLIILITEDMFLELLPFLLFVVFHPGLTT